jgi:hypothetical protein
MAGDKGYSQNMGSLWSVDQVVETQKRLTGAKSDGTVKTAENWAKTRTEA